MTSDSDLTATCFKNYELQRWSDCRLKRVDHHNITLKSTAVFEWLIIFECRRGGCSVNAKERKRLRTYFTNNRKTMFDEMTSIPFVSRKFLLTAMKRVMMWEQSLLVKDIVSLSSNGIRNDVSLQVLFSFCLMQRRGFWWCRWLEWILTKWRYRCLWTSDSVVVSLVTSSTKHLCISGDVFVDVKRKDRETNGKILLSLLFCPLLEAVCFREETSREGRRNRYNNV